MSIALVLLGIVQASSESSGYKKSGRGVGRRIFQRCSNQGDLRAHAYDKDYGYCTTGYYMGGGKLEQVTACD